MPGDGIVKGGELHTYSRVAALVDEGTLRYDAATKTFRFRDDTAELTFAEVAKISAFATPSGADGIGVRDTGGFFATNVLETILAQLGAVLQGGILVKTGNFISDNTDGRVILTGIPAASTVVEIKVTTGAGINGRHEWMLGNAGLFINEGISGNQLLAIDNTRFNLSGSVDFIEGTSGLNFGVGNFVGWQVYYKV